MTQHIASLLLEASAVKLRVDEPFTLRSGIKSPIYCDNRLLISDVPKRKEIIDAFVLALTGLDYDVIAGTATAGIPWAAWVAGKLDKPLVYVRSEAKDHGKGARVEGRLEQGTRVVLLEDLVTTGGSSISAVHALRDAGASVTDVISIVTYELASAKEAFAAAACNLTTLTTYTTLIDAAVAGSYITEDEKTIVAAWRDDPQNWQLVHGKI